MKKQTPTRLLSSFLLLVLTMSSLAGAACSANVKAVPEPQMLGNSAPDPQQRTQVVAALVTTQKANLRRNPSGSAAVLVVVNKGALLALVQPTPVAAWYQVRDSKTDIERWVHGNAISLLQTIGASTTPATGPTTGSDRAAGATDRTPVPTRRTHKQNSTSAANETDGPATSTATPMPGQRPRVASPPPSGRSYVNVDDIRVPSPVFTETQPTGATARCRDGSYSFSQHRRGTCSHHGGVAEWF